MRAGLISTVGMIRQRASGPMPAGKRSACGQDALGELQMGAVDHFAIEGEHPRVRVGGEAGAYLLRPGDPLRRRGEGGGRGGELARVDAELAGEPVGRRLPRLRFQPGDDADRALRCQFKIRS